LINVTRGLVFLAVVGLLIISAIPESKANDNTQVVMFSRVRLFRPVMRHMKRRYNYGAWGGYETTRSVMRVNTYVAPSYGSTGNNPVQYHRAVSYGSAGYAGVNYGCMGE